jgi:hypothetical protein
MRWAVDGRRWTLPLQLKNKSTERRLRMTRFAIAVLTLLVAAGCSGSDATAPNGAVQPAARASADKASSDASVVEFNYEKWFTTYPAMTGNTDFGPGTFSGRVLSRVPFDNGNIVQLEAIYNVTDPSGERSFTAHIEGKTNVNIQTAVLNGVVTDGWRAGSRVHVTFDIVTGCALAVGPSVVGVCYQGTIRVQP